MGETFGSAIGEGPSRATLAAQRVLVLEMAQRSFRPKARPSAWTWFLALVPVAAAASAMVFYLMRARPFEARFQGVTHRRRCTARGARNGVGCSGFFGRKPGRARRQRTRDAGGIDAGTRRAASRTWPGLGEHSQTPRHDVDDQRRSVRGQRDRYTLQRRLGCSRRSARGFGARGARPGDGGDLPASGVILDRGGHLERRATKPSGVAVQGEPATIPERVAPTPRSQKGVETAPVESSSKAIGALAAKGKYKEALALAEKLGFEQLTRELPENDLLLLGNAARYQGNAARARQALVTLRERFAGRPGADLAALYLAKVAEDMAHDPNEAIRWLRAYLKGSPRGDLAAGARASLMSLLLRTGDTAGARAVARDYLLFHENGSHADDARALAGE